MTQEPAVSHPAPGRFAISGLSLGISLFGALASWMAQMELSEILSSYACYPHRQPLAIPLWSKLQVMVAIISAVCFAMGGLSFFVAWRAWRRTRRNHNNEEHRVIEVGEGRACFLAMTGALASALFLVAIVFTACAVLLVEPCKPWSA